MIPKTTAFLLIAAATTIPALAEDAHVHGVGALNLAVDGGVVDMELIAPASDIVGFEHQPRDEADHAAIDNAVAILSDGAALFVFPDGAECTLAKSAVTSGLIDEDDDHGHTKKHDDHDHDEHAEKHDDHDHDNHAGEDNAEHADFEATYRFSCSGAEEMTHMDVRYFDKFPAALELDVQAITPGRGQIAAELTPAASRLVF